MKIKSRRTIWICLKKIFFQEAFLLFSILFFADNVFAQTRNIASRLPEDQLEEASEDFFYGQGIGDATVQIGTAVIFPPYALYLLGNGALDLMGYERLTPLDLLSDEKRKKVDSAYNGVTSVPGRIAAFAAGEDFREAQTEAPVLEQVQSQKGY
jgi:hypothetical protein